jgi:hypothetical protein
MMIPRPQSLEARFAINSTLWSYVHQAVCEKKPAMRYRGQRTDTGG